MKYMLLLRYVPAVGPEEGTPEFDAEMAQWGALTGELAEAGAMLACHGLDEESTATTVRVRDGECVLTDGPFAETKEAFFSYYILDVADLDAAIAWAAEDAVRAPTARSRSGPCRSTRRTPEPLAAEVADLALERAYREEWTTLLATLAGPGGRRPRPSPRTRVADAFAAAAVEWPRQGVPARPGGWLTTVARRRAIDRLRRERPARPTKPPSTASSSSMRDDPDAGADPAGHDQSGVGDDRLRLLFTCCHPALALEARVALTLRAVGGLARRRGRPCLPHQRDDDVPTARPGQAQGLRRPASPTACPPTASCPSASAACSTSSTSSSTRATPPPRGDELIRVELCARGHPPHPAGGRAPARPGRGRSGCSRCSCSPTPAARPAPTPTAGRSALEDQDRARWDRGRDRRGHAAALERALALGAPGPFQVQAAIAALHAEAPAWEIDRLAPDRRALRRARAARPVAGHHVQPRGRGRPGRRAPARAWRSSPRSSRDERLARYQPLHATRAELLAPGGRPGRSGRPPTTTPSTLTDNQLERAALERRRAACWPASTTTAGQRTGEQVRAERDQAAGQGPGGLPGHEVAAVPQAGTGPTWSGKTTAAIRSKSG